MTRIVFRWLRSEKEKGTWTRMMLLVPATSRRGRMAEVVESGAEGWV